MGACGIERLDGKWLVLKLSRSLLGGDTRGMPRDGCEEMGIGKPCVHWGFAAAWGCCLLPFTCNPQRTARFTA